MELKRAFFYHKNCLIERLVAFRLSVQIPFIFYVLISIASDMKKMKESLKEQFYYNWVFLIFATTFAV